MDNMGIGFGYRYWIVFLGELFGELFGKWKKKSHADFDSFNKKIHEYKQAQSGCKFIILSPRLFKLYIHSIHDILLNAIAD
jgi:hypothetical protein